jgi:hypothetical protein
MKSILHRLNILHPDFTHCGIGIVSVKNNLYITQEFARLYVPLKKEVVEKLIEADLKDWFRETYNTRLTIFPQLKNHARLYSIQNLMGLDIDTSPLEWGKFYIVNFISPALEDIKADLRKEIKDMNLQGASVGATIGRNTQYPGGTYSLSILLFGNRYKNYSPQQLSQLIMTTINEKRKRNQIKLLKKNKNLSRKAENIAERSYNHPENRFRFFSVYLVLTYKTENPRIFPPGVEEVLLKKKGIAKNIGVGVFSPLSKKLPGNYFIVTFILKI